MTRAAFILRLEKYLAEKFQGWQEQEQELTFEDIQTITEQLTSMRGKAVMELWAKREPEVKA